MRELVKTIRNVESTTAGRSGFWSISRGRSCGWGRSPRRDPAQERRNFVLDSDKGPGRQHSRVQLPHPEILAALKPGHALLLDDGKVRLIAEEPRPRRAVTPCRDRRPDVGSQGRQPADTDLPVSAMTPKDRADL